MNKLPIYKKMLQSGVEIIFVKKNDTPIVNLHLIYRVGSKNEPKGMHGFAHLFEHLMFEGTEKFPKGTFDSTCAKAGGTNNAYTTYDWTMYYMALPKASLHKGLELEADRLYNLNLNAEVLNNQKNVVTEEIKQVVHNQPYGQWRDIQAKNAFIENCGYNWEVHGEIEDVQNATLENCKTFHDHYYAPSNLHIVITGDYEPDELFELCEKHFGQEKKPASLIVPDYNYTEKLFGSEIFLDNVPYDAIFLSYHIPGFLDPETFTADVLAGIAGKGKSSLLYHDLMYEEQIVSEVGVFPDKRENMSLLTFYAIANTPETTAEILQQKLLSKIEKLGTIDIIKNRIDATKNQIKMGLANNLLSGYGLSEAAALNATFFNDPSRMFETMERYQKIDVEQILSFFNKYIKDQEYITTMIKKKT